MGATLEETLAELNSGTTPSPSGAPSGSQSPEGGSAQGPGGGGEPAKTPSPEPTGEPLPDSDGATGAFMRGAGDSATFGFLDEAGGLVDTLGLTDGRSNVWNSEGSFGDILSGNIAKNRAIMASDWENHPVARGSGLVAGALVLPYGSKARTATELAQVGAVQGAISGVGSGESWSGRAVGAVTGGVLGAGMGAALGAVGNAIGTKIRARFGKAAPEAAVDAENGLSGLAGTVTDEGIPAETVQARIVALDKDGQPILAGDAQEGASAPLNALVKVEGEAGSSAGKAEEAVPTEGPGTDLVPINRAVVVQGSEEASEETVGTIGREELAKLQAAIERKAPEIDANERSADITWENSPDVARVAGEWRIGSIGGSSEARAMLSGLAHTTGPKGKTADFDLMRSARARADAIGEDPEAMLAYAQELAGSVGDLDHQMATVQTVMQRMSADVTDVHLMNVDWSTASDDLVAEAAQRIYNLQTLSSEFQRIKTGLGRGLRVRQLPSADSYLNRLTSSLSGTPPEASEGLPAVLPQTRQEISDWLEVWGMTGGDPRRQAAILKGRVTLPSPGRYLRTSLANYFTANILSAPRTLMLNLIGPGVISTIKQVERHTGAALTSINPLLSAQERRSARAVAQVSARAWVTTFTEVQDIFRMSLVAAKRNQSVIGGGGSAVDVNSGFGPITDGLRSAAQGGTTSIGADFAYGFGNALNMWPRAFARVNNGLDEFAKRMAYQTEARTDALVAAAEQGLDPDATRLMVNDRMAQAYNSEGHATSEELLREAERSTLTMRVGEPGSNTRAVASAIQRARNAVPELRFILPVFNVPANGIAETLRRLPTAALPGLLGRGLSNTADELAGRFGAIRQADAHGRMLLGASWMTAGIMLARSGNATGAGPQDPEDRNIWLQTHQPYSIKIDGNWVRYDKYDLIGGLLSIPTTVHDATVYNPEDQGVSEIISSGMGALAQWFKDKAAIRQATGILALGDDPTKNFGDVAGRLAGNLASGLVVPAWMRVGITDTTSPEMAMRNSWMDYIQSATPGWANSAEPIRNVLGEPVIKSQETVGEAIFPVSLVKAIGYDDDPVLDELDRIYQITGYGAGADSSALSYGFFDPKDVKLESGRSIQYRAGQMRQTMLVGGATLRQSLDALFKSPEYNAGVDADSGSRLTSRGDASRGYMVANVFKRYNAEIKKTLASESPLAKDYLVAAAAKKRDDAYLRDVTVEDLVKNPALYQAKGVNRATLEQGLTGQSGTDALLSALGAK